DLEGFCGPVHSQAAPARPSWRVPSKAAAITTRSTQPVFSHRSSNDVNGRLTNVINAARNNGILAGRVSAGSLGAMTRILERWTPQMTAILRIVVGLLYLQGGTAKVLHVPHVPAFDDILPFSWPWFGGLSQLVGSVLLILGLCTRYAAFIMFFVMAAIYCLV